MKKKTNNRITLQLQIYTFLQILSFRIHVLGMFILHVLSFRMVCLESVLLPSSFIPMVESSIFGLPSKLVKRPPLDWEKESSTIVSTCEKLITYTI